MYPRSRGLRVTAISPSFSYNFDFATQKITGGYEYRISVLDAGGNGYDIVAPFQVTVPEPSTWMMMMLGFVALGFARYRASRRSEPAAG